MTNIVAAGDPFFSCCVCGSGLLFPVLEDDLNINGGPAVLYITYTVLPTLDFKCL